MRRAKGLDNSAGMLKMHSWHGWKEVMLNLVVEATEEEIPDRVRGDVA